MTIDLLITRGRSARRSEAFASAYGLPKIPPPDAKLKGGENGWSIESLNEYSVKGGELVSTYGLLEKAKEVIEGEIDTVGRLSTSYITAVKKIRSELQNDVESIAKASQRLGTETSKMLSAYRGVVELWTSEDMKEAINNAERLTKALAELAAVERAKVSISVFGNGAHE